MGSNCNCHGGDGQLSTASVGVLERPRYSPGLILEDSDLTAAVDYTRDLNRLLFRSLFGCGVICGLEVSAKEDCGLVVSVAPGLGLDGCGDPLHLLREVSVTLPRRDVLIDCGADGSPRHTDFWVVACNRERACAPRRVVCDGDDLDCASQPTRWRSAVEVSITFEQPDCACGCGTVSGSGDLADRARRNRAAQMQRDRGDWAGQLADYAEECHADHYSDPGCATDCACGTACSNGCCIVLAWGHWSRDGEVPGWEIMHHAVRRFVRPVLMPDPRWDYAAQPSKDDLVEISNTNRNAIERALKANIAASVKAASDPKAIDVQALVAETARALAAEAEKLGPQLRDYAVKTVSEAKPAAQDG